MPRLYRREKGEQMTWHFEIHGKTGKLFADGEMVSYGPMYSWEYLAADPNGDFDFWMQLAIIQERLEEKRGTHEPQRG